MRLLLFITLALAATQPELHDSNSDILDERISSVPTRVKLPDFNPFVWCLGVMIVSYPILAGLEAIESSHGIIFRVGSYLPDIPDLKPELQMLWLYYSMFRTFFSMAARGLSDPIILSLTSLFAVLLYFFKWLLRDN